MQVFKRKFCILVSVDVVTVAENDKWKGEKCTRPNLKRCFGDPTGRSADPEEAATAPVRHGKNADDGRRARSIEQFLL